MSDAFTFKTRAELKKLSPLELNVYIAELKKRAGWLQGAARKDVEQRLQEATTERDTRRASG